MRIGCQITVHTSCRATHSTTRMQGGGAIRKQTSVTREVDNIVGVVCNAPPFARSGRSGVASRPWLKYRDNIRHRRRCDKTWKVAPRCGYALLCRYDRVAARQRRGLLSPQYTVHIIAIAGFKLIFPSEPHIFHKIRTSLPLATLDRAPRASPSIHVSAPLNGNSS